MIEPRTPCVAIVDSAKAFLPEVDAYSAYLASRGLRCVVVSTMEDALVSGAPAVILFYGWFPIWRPRPRILIADINSRSAGRFRSVRDMLKANVNHRPDIRIVQNDYVKSSRIGHGARFDIHRGMGFFEESLKSREASVYDVIYAGTLARRGVVEALRTLADLGFHVCVAGREFVSDLPTSIHQVGALKTPELYELYSVSRIGLNFTPDAEPFRYQDSTKLIEYCAAGLGVLTTRYRWVDDFERDRGGRFLSWQEDLTREQIESFDFQVPYVADLSWRSILDQSGIFEAIIRELGIDPGQLEPK